jgi:TfoX/Sxy family transcriptional regulator of competence genes
LVIIYQAGTCNGCAFEKMRVFAFPGGESSMASSSSYFEFIMDQLSGLEGITFRTMMGEYIIYYREKIVGGIYDDRFLVKSTESSRAMMPDAAYELPYEGSKEMLLVDDVENRTFLEELFTAMYDELPSPRKKRSI